MSEQRIRLTDREYPKDRVGDPCFESLTDVQKYFADWEIVELVKRQIKMALTANESNKKRMARLREMERPVREAAKRLWPEKSFADLTPMEYTEAVSNAYPVVGEQKRS